MMLLAVQELGILPAISAKDSKTISVLEPNIAGSSQSAPKHSISKWMRAQETAVLTLQDGSVVSLEVGLC